MKERVRHISAEIDIAFISQEAHRYEANSCANKSYFCFKILLVLVKSGRGAGFTSRSKATGTPKIKARARYVLVGSCKQWHTRACRPNAGDGRKPVYPEGLLAGWDPAIR